MAGHIITSVDDLYREEDVFPESCKSAVPRTVVELGKVDSQFAVPALVRRGIFIPQIITEVNTARIDVEGRVRATMESLLLAERLQGGPKEKILQITTETARVGSPLSDDVRNLLSCWPRSSKNPEGSRIVVPDSIF